mgnify:CR=1 FL=1
MDSKVLYKIQKEELIQGKSVEVTDYITEFYVYTKRKGGKEFLYLKNQNKFYEILRNKKELLETSQKGIKKELDRLKNLLPEISTDVEHLEDKNIHTTQSKSNSIVLLGETHSKKIDGLSSTAYFASNKYHSSVSIIDLDLESNEFISFSEVSLNIQGQLIESKSEVKVVEEVLEDRNRFDFLQRFSVEGRN